MKLNDFIKISNYAPKDGKQQKLDYEAQLAKVLADPQSAYESYKNEFYNDITEAVNQINLLSEQLKFLESKVQKSNALKEIIEYEILYRKNSIVHCEKLLEKFKLSAIESEEKPMSFEEWKEDEVNGLKSMITYYEKFEKTYDDKNKIYQEMIKELNELDD